MTSPSDVYKPSFGQLGWRAVILALTAALTIIVLSVADRLSAPAEHPRAAAAMISVPAKAKSGEPVTKPIVPAKPIDPELRSLHWNGGWKRRLLDKAMTWQCR